ncbi:MAG: N-acetylneuraminate synthase family protein [Pseudomonadota bacterium]
MKTKIIAEVASNHGGDINLAKEYIRIAAQIGVDYIKFQSWQISKLSKDDSQYDWFKQSELKDDDHYELIEECKNNNITFLTTVFDTDRIEFLKGLGIEEIKVASPDLSSYRMLSSLKDSFKHLIVSTGMHYKEEVQKAADILKDSNFTFMHCVSLYPTPPDKTNLEKMQWLKKFTNSVGYSDHTVGTEVVKFAISQGASYIEKHFCLGKYGPGRVMPWDADPYEMEEIVKYAEMANMLLGKDTDDLTEDEKSSRQRFIGRFGDNG